MNFLSAKLGPESKSCDLVGNGDTRLSLALPTACTAGPGTGVTLGVRPEHLTPEETGPLEFEIQLIEPLGADTLLHCRFGEARELVTVRMGGHVLAKPGERRRFAVATDKLHVFNSQTGKRVANGS